MPEMLRCVSPGYGPSRHFAAAQQLGRSLREADINWRPRPASSVANDPEQTLTHPRINPSLGQSRAGCAISSRRIGVVAVLD